MPDRAMTSRRRRNCTVMSVLTCYVVYVMPPLHEKVSAVLRSYLYSAVSHNNSRATTSDFALPPLPHRSTAFSGRTDGRTAANSQSAEN